MQCGTGKNAKEFDMVARNTLGVLTYKVFTSIKPEAKDKVEKYQ